MGTPQVILLMVMLCQSVTQILSETNVRLLPPRSGDAYEHRVHHLHIAQLSEGFFDAVSPLAPPYNQLLCHHVKAPSGFQCNGNHLCLRFGCIECSTFADGHLQTMQNIPGPFSLCLCAAGFTENIAPAISQMDMILCLCKQPRYICDLKQRDMFFPKYCMYSGTSLDTSHSRKCSAVLPEPWPGSWLRKNKLL